MPGSYNCPDIESKWNLPIRGCRAISSTNETEIPGYIDFSEKEAYNKNVTKMSQIGKTQSFRSKNCIRNIKNDCAVWLQWTEI